MIRKPERLDRAAAQDIAVKALTLLVSDPERLARFLALTGLGPDTIRAAAGSPDFLAAVLDYVVHDEVLLVGLADEIGARPDSIVEARRLLGPAAPEE